MRQPSNAAAFLLQNVGLSGRQIATKLGGVPHATVARWLAGQCVPSPEHRALIRQHFPVPESAWFTLPPASATGATVTAPAPGVPPTAAPAVAHDVPADGDLLDGDLLDIESPAALQALVTQCRLKRAEPDISSQALAQLARVEISAVAMHERLTGVSQKRLMASAAWQAMFSVIMKSMRPFPQASRALAKALLEFDSKGQ